MKLEGTLFTIQSFDASDATERINLKVYQQEHYKVVFITKGKGVHHLEENAYPFDRNSVCFASPGRTTHLKMRGTVSGYLLTFSEGFLYHHEDGQLSGDLSRLFFLFSQYQCMHLHFDMAQEITETLAKMNKEFGNSFALKHEMLRRYLKILLILLERQAGLTGVPENPFANMQLVGKFFFPVREKLPYR